MNRSADAFSDASGGDWSPPLAGLFGTGRSGSTWLGAILNAHPDLAYRFEPLHRLRDHSRLEAIGRRLKALDFTPDDVSQLYEALLPAHPAIDRPPFFSKNHAPTAGKHLAWTLARKFPLLSPAFEKIYSPRCRPPVLFKEVDLAPAVETLAQGTTVRLIYVVRHPVAVVDSLIRGQDRGVMPKERFKVLGNLLHERDSALAGQWADRLDDATDAQKNALLWRLEVEQAVAAMKNRPHAMIVVYEDLCRHPHQRAAEALDHLGLTMHDQVEQFIESSTHFNQAARRRHGEWFVDRYFTVFRDSARAADRWRQSVSADIQQQVHDVVADGPAFQWLQQIGHWNPRD